MRKQIWCEDDTELLKLLYDQGMAVKTIAVEMEWSDTTIETWIRKLGLSRVFRWSDEKDLILKELVYAGRTSKEIAGILGCKDDTVKRRKVNLGLSLRKGINSLSITELKDREELLCSKKMAILNYAGVTGDSTIQCTKCNGTWQTRITDVIRRDQNCPYCSPIGVSKIAIAWLDELNIETREFPIPGTKFRVDGFDKITNTVYEFLGDYWHGNPESFDPNDIHPSIGSTYKELHQTTVVDRFNKLKELGYSIIFIWEKDYKSGKIPQIWQ